MKNKPIILAGSVDVIALFIVIIYTLFRSAQAARQPFTDEDPDTAFINRYQQELTDPDLLAEGREDIEGRIGLLSKLATQQAEGNKNPAPRDPQQTPVVVSEEDYYKISGRHRR